jgi:hypothetical protein
MEITDMLKVYSTCNCLKITLQCPLFNIFTTLMVVANTQASGGMQNSKECIIISSFNAKRSYQYSTVSIVTVARNQASYY